MSGPESIRDTIRATVEEVPALPLVVPKILAILEDDDANASTIADAISHDPALTARILRLANSAYYGLSGQVSTLQKAIVLIGLRSVKSIALTIPLVGAIPARRLPGIFSQSELWIHSLAVAIAIQRLAHRCGFRRPESLFLAGVMHDIGKAVLGEYYSHSFQHALTAVQRREYPFLKDAERDIFGIDHGEVAALLLTHWRFPTSISSVIAHHHADEVPEEVDVKQIALLRTANCLVQELGIGSAGNVIPPEIAADDLENLGIAEEDLDEVAAFLDQKRQGISDFYSSIA
jgi:putative nucleotidyltransferase with HDIG domain